MNFDGLLYIDKSFFIRDTGEGFKLEIREDCDVDLPKMGLRTCNMRIIGPEVSQYCKGEVYLLEEIK